MSKKNDLDYSGYVHCEGRSSADEHEDAHVQGKSSSSIGQEDEGVEVRIGVIHHRL